MPITMLMQIALLCFSEVAFVEYCLKIVVQAKRGTSLSRKCLFLKELIM